MKKFLLSLAMVAFANSAIGQVILEEDFEGTTFPPAGWNVTQTNATLFWKRSAPGKVGAGSAFIPWQAGKGAQDESLISPVFDLSTYTASTPVYLNFSVWLGYEYMVDPFDYGDFKAEISEDNGTNWITLWKEADQGVYADYSQITKSLDLSAYAGKSNLQIRFNFGADDADSVYLDGVSISTFQDNGFVLKSKTDVSFQLDVILNSTSYDFQYGVSGFTLGNGTISSDQTATSIDVTGLTPGTRYEYYVRSKTGTNYGAWEGPFAVYTSMYDTAANLNYNYGFETDNLAVAGWFTQKITAAGNNWTQLTDAPNAKEGINLIYLLGSTASTSESWLFSRPITLKAGTTVNVNYSVKKLDVAGTTATGNLKVTIGTLPTVAGQTTELAASAAVSSLTYVDVTKPFAVPADGTYYLGFQGTFDKQTALLRNVMLLDAISVVDPALSSNDFISSKFSVSPNPANDVVTIANADNMLVNNVTVTDLNGRTVKNVSFEGVANAQVNVADLASGLYIMNVTSDKGTATKKFVKN